MDFKTTYSEKQENFRREVRDWLNTHVPPDMEFPPELEELDEKTYAFAKALRARLAEKGWLAPSWPKEYGGGGFSLEECLILEEEFAKRTVPRQYDLGRIAGAGILALGTDEQKKKWLPLIAGGKIVVWQSFTEPDAGSDLASLRLRAVNRGDRFILNGQKTYTGDGHPVDYLYALTITDPKAPRHRNMTAFMVKADLPGISISPLDPLAGSRKNTVYFDEVPVPEDCLIGEINRGWEVALASLQGERGIIGAHLYHLHQLFEDFLEYCKNTKRNGQPLSRDAHVQEVLVNLYLDLKVQRLLFQHTSWKISRGLKVTYEAPRLALYVKTFLPKFAAAVLEIAGPCALLSDSRWALFKGEMEHFQRRSLMTHGGGTPEVIRVTLARALGLGRKR